MYNRSGRGCSAEWEAAEASGEYCLVSGGIHSGFARLCARVEDVMYEVVFRPPNAILFVAIGVVVVGLISAFLKKGETGRKIAALVIVIVVAGGLVLVLYRPVTLTVDADGITTSGLNGIEISWDEVDHAYYETNLVVSEYRPTVRSRGAAIGNYRSGRFILSNGNPARVLMERADQAVIIVTPDLTYLFAPRDVQSLADAVNEYRPLPGGAP